MTAGDMESAAPTITVLTPTYNRADKLGRLFESLTAQTYRDFEWVVVDDGSVDDTARVMEAWVKDARFKYHRLPKNIGNMANVMIQNGGCSHASSFCTTAAV